MPRRREDSIRLPDWPRPVSVTELAASLYLLPAPDLRRYADRLLTRVAVAKLVLQRLDPEEHDRWYAELATRADAVAEDLARHTAPQKPS